MSNLQSGPPVVAYLSTKTTEDAIGPFWRIEANIPFYINIFKGAYERPDKYVAKNKTRKIKKIYK